MTGIIRQMEFTDGFKVERGQTLFVTPAFYIVFQKLHERLTPVKD